MSCSFNGCGRPIKNKTLKLCGGHYAQHRKGKSLTEIVDGKRNKGKNAGDIRQCYLCKQWLPFTAFYENKNGSAFTRCKECNVLRKWKLNALTYKKLLDKQGGRCVGCLQPPAKVGKLVVDHDHTCCPKQESCGKCIRGLLCGGCNTALGGARDNITTLKRLIDYLKEPFK